MEILKVNEIGPSPDDHKSRLVLIAHKNQTWFVWAEEKAENLGVGHSLRPAVKFSSEREANHHFVCLTDQLADF